MATQAMSDLTLASSSTSTTKAKNTKSQKAAQAVADSWEDEAIESDTETTSPSQQEPEPLQSPLSPSLDLNPSSGFAAPPPTPSSPSYSAGAQPPWQPMVTSPPGSPASVGSNDSGFRRPEKTDAVARRMIASALGVRAPRATEEQRAYDRAVREKERKRREEEREAEKRRKEEAERARAAIWED